MSSGDRGTARLSSGSPLTLVRRRWATIRRSRRPCCGKAGPERSAVREITRRRRLRRERTGQPSSQARTGSAPTRPACTRDARRTGTLSRSRPRATRARPSATAVPDTPRASGWASRWARSSPLRMRSAGAVRRGPAGRRPPPSEAQDSTGGLDVSWRQQPASPAAWCFASDGAADRSEAAYGPQVGELPDFCGASRADNRW